MGSNGLRRVTFTFSGETEVRYIPRVPEVGDRVTYGSEIWVVAQVHIDRAGALVICGRSARSNGPLVAVRP